MYWVTQFKNYNSFEKNKKDYFGYKVKQIHINYTNNSNNCLLQNKIMAIKKLRENLMLRFFLNISYSYLNRLVIK
jgi:hypothetical protein